MGKGTIRSEKNLSRFLHRVVAQRSPDILAQSVSPLRVPFPSYTQTCTDHRALPEQSAGQRSTSGLLASHVDGGARESN